MYQTIQTKLLTVKEASDIFVRTPEDVATFCKDISALSQESVHVLTFNTKQALIDRHLVSLGILDASLLHPREIFRACVLDSAASFIIVHNHPSGDCTPSAEDIRITKKIMEASKIMEIQMLDHIVIGRKNNKAIATSIREEGLVTF